MATSANPTVSVVIAAYDEERYIGACLRSLLVQTFRPLEVIVVDDGSRDRTAAIARAVGGVTLIRQGHRGAGAARNRGAAAATGKILVFCDADMWFPPPFVERLVAPIVERGAIGTFTKEILVANAHRPWARAHMLGRNLPTTSHFRPGFPDEWENFRAIWKRDFDRVGGFDEVGHGEDVTLGRKLGRLAVAAQGATCYHHEPDTLRDIFLSGRWVGRGERIKELPRVGQRAFVLRSLRLSLGLARRHRMPSLALYRMVYDGGVLVGLLTRGRGGSGR